MAFNELEAIKLVDEGKITDKEIKFLVNTRYGVAKADVEDDPEYQSALDHGYVQIVALSHPRADISVDAVIPTEPGVTILNLFDKRFRENTDASADANTAPNVDPKLVKAPTDEEARKVPSIEAKPLEGKDKRLGNVPKAHKEAMKDPLVAAGARDISNAQLDSETVLTDDAKVVVPKDASVGVNTDGTTKAAPKKA